VHNYHPLVHLLLAIRVGENLSVTALLTFTNGREGHVVLVATLSRVLKQVDLLVSTVARDFVLSTALAALGRFLRILPRLL